jgi:hypothetical protein
MSKDLFNGAAHPSAISEIDTFRWIVGVFQADGAVQVIKRAYEHELATFYPIRINRRGEYVPLWANYLFVEFRELVTIQLCRSTSKFLQIISTHDEEGILRPVFARRNAIEETLRLLAQGKFNELEYKRRFYGRGSIVRVIEGALADKTVRLDEDILPTARGNQKIKIDINGIKATIDLFKLAL